MLIELDSFSNGGAQISFPSDENIRVLRKSNRPMSLYLPSRFPSFNPTLPATPEEVAIQDRNLYKVSGINGIEATGGLNSSLCDIFQTNTNLNAKNTRTANACCYWLAKRWHKLRRKQALQASPKSTRSLKIFNRPTSASLNRQRAATISHSEQRAATIFRRNSVEKENKRDWGEERQDDVIYNVVLKKIGQICSPASSEQSQADGLQYMTQKVRYIKGATLSHLVSELCRSQVESDDWKETNFLAVFFSSYRSFTNATEVLDLIVREKEKLKNDPVEKRRLVMRSILHVLRYWVEKYFKEDFYLPPDHFLLKRFHNIAEEFYEDEAVTKDESGSFDTDCDLLTFAKSMLQKAEVQSLQEKPCEDLARAYSHILDETDDVTVDEDYSQRFLQSSFTPQLIAEQLTIQDANLFMNVVPHHCLVWARSSKEKPATVKATVDQFNRVVYCVLGTSLSLSLRMTQRAKVIAKWIEVAKACYDLRNFSSLFAIVSSLQSYPIHRLKKTWQLVSSTHTAQLNELQKINRKDLLSKVLNDTTSGRLGKEGMVRRNQTVRPGAFLGTVPYLGSFLTDLTHLHTAKPDYIEKNLINFSKMRKENEMLSQLQLWQTTCRIFKNLQPDDRFYDWFNSVTLPTDEQANQMSNDIERKHSTSPAPGTPVKQILSEMLANQVLDVSGIGVSLKNNGHKRTSSNDLSNLSISDNEQNPPRSNGHALVDTSNDKEERIVNVHIITKLLCTIGLANTLSPKKLKLSSNDRCHAFMKKVFSVFGKDEENPKNYQLIQILPGNKELAISESDNVYYAMNSSTKEYSFILLQEGAEIPKKDSPNNPSLTLPRKQKKKKKNRTTQSTSSINTPLSPIKRFSRQLGISAIVLAAPSTSLVKDEILSEPSSTNQIRKKSSDESIFSSNTNSSDESTAEETLTLTKKMKKLIKKNKLNQGSIRNQANARTHQSTSKKQNLCDFADLDEPFQKQTCDSDRDEMSVITANSRSRVQDSSNSLLTNTNDITSVDPFPIKEKKTISEFSKTSSETPNTKKSLEKCGSRSKFYVSFQNSQSSGRLNSYDNAENDVNITKTSLTRPFSDPCILELVADDEEVFGAEGDPPLIILQCPSPNSPDEKVKVSNESDKTKTFKRGRVASETRTTYL